jgi:acyl-CoA thioesterase
VPARACAGNGRLFGGSALAAAISSSEGATALTAKWVAAQYIRPVEKDASLVLEVSIDRVGRILSQVGVRVLSEEGVPSFVAFLLLTNNAGAPVEVTEPPPRTLPAAAPERSYRFSVSPSVRDELDVRIAGVADSNRLDLWARMRKIPTEKSAVVGLLADHLAFALEHLVSPEGSVSTISSTLSFGHIRETEWVHLALQLSPLGEGFWHGQVTATSDDRTLLATGAQVLHVTASRSTGS